MAGILANSASKTMVSGDTAADNTASGYVTAEQVTLSTTPTGTDYVWSLSKPAGSTSRSDLSDAIDASPVFVPDVAGYWVVSCVVDSTTTYVLRLSVAQVAIADPVQGMRFSPVLASQIVAPALGQTVYHDTTSGLLSAKQPNATVKSLQPRAFTPTSSADATGVKGDLAYDDNYVYVRTSAGWARAALGSF